MTLPPQGPKTSWFKPGHHSRTENHGCQIEGHVKEQYTLQGRIRYRCRDCNLARARRYASERLHRYKQQCIKAYGSKCECCGELEVTFLCIDHIGGGGNAWRKANVKGSMPTYRWLINHNFPEGFRVLCHNCNYATSIGVCPHQGGDAQ